MLKKHLLFCFFLLTALAGFGQNVFYNFPKNSQFYQQDSLGFSDVNIFGSVANDDYKAIKLTILQDGELYFSETTSLIESNKFSWNHSLVSGLFEYDFEIKLFLENDSTSMAKASKVLCGDTYLIYGQSNAVAGCCFDMVRHEMDHTFLRNFIYDHFDPSSSNNGWHDLGVEFNWPGVLGSRLAENIIKNNHIPVQIINGAVGGESLEALVERDFIDPENPETYYGRFLKRILGSNSVRPKGFIFSQGEWESDTGIPEAMESYRERFNKLIANLKEDGTEPEYYYLVQTNILTRTDRRDAPAKLRDIQRRLKEDFPELRMYAAFGKEVSGDGLHYAKPGFESIADDLYLGINRDVYDANINSPVTGPLIQKAVLSKVENKVTLVFDEGQRLKLENVKDFGHYQRRFKDYVYDAKGKTFIDSAKASANEVELYFSGEFERESITYLPSFFSDHFSNTYNGPIIQNRNDLPALSFSNFKTCEAFPRPNVLSSTLVDKGVSLKLAKNADCISCDYQFFGRAEGSDEYDLLGSQDNSADSMYIDLSWSGKIRNVFIKVKAVSNTCQSDYVEIKLNKCPLEEIKENLPFISDRLNKNKASRMILMDEKELILNLSGFSRPRSGYQAQGKGAFLNEIGRCVTD